MPLRLLWLALCSFFIISPVYSAQEYATDLEAASSQYWIISDANQTGLDIGTEATIEFWTNPESLGGSPTPIISKWDTGATQCSYKISISSTGLYLALENGSCAGNFDSMSYTFNTATWVHIALVFEDVGSTYDVDVYIDGILQDTLSLGPSAIGDSTASFLIGGQLADSTWDGIIDEVRFWSDIRTANEILNNYDQECLIDETGLVSFWRFENDATDSYGSNDLTAANSPTFTTSTPSLVACGGGESDNDLITIITTSTALTFFINRYSTGIGWVLGLLLVLSFFRMLWGVYLHIKKRNREYL